MSDEFDPASLADIASGSSPASDAGDELSAEQTAPDTTGDTSGGETSATGSLREFLTGTPSKSHREVDAADFFDLEGGGRRRLALVASDYLGSDRPPRFVQLLVGLLEEGLRFFDHFPLDEDDGDELDAGDGDAADSPDAGVPAA